MIKFPFSLFEKDKANVIVFGISYNKESEKSLKQLREISYFVEPFDFLGNNLLQNAKVFDAGNFKIKNLEEVSNIFRRIKNEDKVPLMLSRGHLPTLYTVKNLKKEKLIVLDAHADCKNEYLDSIIAIDVDRNKDRKKFNGSTWLRRLIEESSIQVLLIGIRAFDKEEIKFLEEKGVKYFTSAQILERDKKMLSEIEKFTRNSEIYLSLDFDIFDPSVFPAVDYPEPGGIGYYEFIEIINAIKGKLIGADACCFKPLENNLVSAFLAIKSIFHILSKI
jgi:agmatinase